MIEKAKVLNLKIKYELAECAQRSECLTISAKSWVLSQHLPTLCNLRGS
jgi:hypothetical protein